MHKVWTLKPFSCISEAKQGITEEEKAEPASDVLRANAVTALLWATKTAGLTFTACQAPNIVPHVPSSIHKLPW
jgi:hypothetical protein